MENKQKTKHKMSDLSPNGTKITLIINYLNTPLRDKDWKIQE